MCHSIYKQFSQSVLSYLYDIKVKCNHAIHILDEKASRPNMTEILEFCLLMHIASSVFCSCAVITVIFFFILLLSF